MNDDMLKSLWATQNVEPVVLPNDAQLDKIRQEAHQLERTIRWRDIRENIAAVVVIGIFGIYYFIFPFWLARLGCVMTIAGAIFSCAYLEWRKRSIRSAPPDASVVEVLKIQMRKVETQINLLRTIHWWYLLPLAIGPIVFYFGVNTSATGRLLFVCFVLALDVFIYWLNSLVVKKTLEPLKQRLMLTLSPDASARTSTE